MNIQCFKRNIVKNLKTSLKNSIKLPDSSPDYYWDLNKVAFSLLPLGPGERRKTVVAEIVKDEIWTLDQLQGLVNVYVPVRSTIVKLKSGGLFVYNPVAPTRECLKIIKNLENIHGKIQFIVLGSLGLEHKALAASFAQKFPSSQIYIQPGQWSFPINLPIQFLGFPVGKNLNVIPTNASDSPWYDDFDHEILGSFKFNSVGGFGETVFFHRKTNTLLLTDTIINVPNEPPPIILDDPRALLFHSRDNMFENVIDNLETRLRGWRRMVLFSLVFVPSGIQIDTIITGLMSIFKIQPHTEILGRGTMPFNGGFYPWKWTTSEVDNFKAFQGGLLVAPILRQLILNRESESVIKWVEKVSKWPIKRIIPSHFENNIQTNSNEFRRAFSFLYEKSDCPNPFASDIQLLSTLSNIFTKLGIVAPAKPLLPNKLSSNTSSTVYSSFSWIETILNKFKLTILDL